MRQQLLELLRVGCQQLSLLFELESGAAQRCLRCCQLYQRVERRAWSWCVSVGTCACSVVDLRIPAVHQRVVIARGYDPPGTPVVGDPAYGARLCVHLCRVSMVLASASTEAKGEGNCCVCFRQGDGPKVELACTSYAVFWPQPPSAPGQRRDCSLEAARCGRSTTQPGTREADQFI